jgi:drug/metabolite transporter (DMT)-like permease
MVALGVLMACCASALFNLAIVVQAREARLVPTSHALHPSLLVKLLQRPLWLAGAGLQAAAICLQAGALFFAPLTAAQPAEAVGLLLLLFLGARMLHERVGRREWLAVFGIVGGVVLVTLLAPEHTTSEAPGPAMAAALGLLALGGLAPLLFRAAGREAPPLLMVVGAGLCFSWSVFGIKLVTNDILADNWLGAAAWGVAAVGIGAAGTLIEMSALQVRPATRVAPIIFVLEFIVPVLLAVLVGGESWTGGLLTVAGLLAGVLLVAACAGSLGGSATVAGMIAAGHAEAASDSASTSEAADGTPASEVSGGSGSASASASAADSSDRDVATSASP